MDAFFPGQGRWLKCNLHTHTTRSDGAYTPEDCMALYRRGGYDVLALTDHWKPSDNGSYEGMTLLSGCEWDLGASNRDAGCVHIVGVGMTADAGLTRSPSLTAQGVADAIVAAGGVPILAHPAWSLTQPLFAAGLRGIVGAEVYNAASAFPFTGRPDSTEFVDQCANIGRLLRCMGADDAHWYQSDALNAYTMVYARDNSREAVLDALRAGWFYASQGPVLHSLVRRDNVLTVECSDCAYIGFLSASPWMAGRVVQNASSARYEIKPYDGFIRIELVDREGKRAWIGPFSI